MENHIVLLDQQDFKTQEYKNLNFSIIPNDLLLSAYKTSDVYVSASLIEGFALTLVEAMAAGLPLVASDVPGNEDAVINGQNGFLVPPKDPSALARGIIDILKQNDMRAVFSANAKNLAKKYDWSIIAGQYITGYRSLK